MDLATKIIRNLTGADRTIRRDYLEHLVSASQADPEEESSGLFGMRLRRDTTFGAGKKMVDRVYRLFEPYAVELDHIIGPGGFKIACTPPEESSETINGEWPFRPPEILSYYRARFSTSRLSIVVRAHQNKVEFYLLPVEFIMMLSKAEDEYGPLMSFEAQETGAIVQWEVEQKPLTDERFERYCLLLFEYFVREHQRLLMQVS